MEDDTLPFSYVSTYSKEYDEKAVKKSFISLKDSSEPFVTININKPEST